VLRGLAHRRFPVGCLFCQSQALQPGRVLVESTRLSGDIGVGFFSLTGLLLALPELPFSTSLSFL